jgi:hypothetical protein
LALWGARGQLRELVVGSLGNEGAATRSIGSSSRSEWVSIRELQEQLVELVDGSLEREEAGTGAGG